ncbi:terminase large subunit [Brochothrix phage A9]|uniref:Gp63 n=1 Tax=Brochothrix phage A9 TaxID=857312 RepID=D9J0L0_9CAUD|nr:terminase large subunit [Brochothrix phage A9]ADJ53103.1 gp63 [Brochothrix phage A9]
MAIVARDIENTLREDMPDMLHSRGDYTSVVVGIDWGEHFHWVVVMGRRANGLVDIMRVFNVKSSKSNTKDIEADIKSLIAQVDLYSPDLILADIGFSGNYIAKLINAFGKHRTFGVQVNPAKSNGQVHPVWNENGNKVTIDKLTQNTIFIEAIKTKRVGLWSNKTAERNMFTEHWTNVVIRDVEDERTGEIQKEITRKGDDHWAQASVYANVAMNHIIDNVTSRSNAFNYTDVSGQDNLGF